MIQKVFHIYYNDVINKGPNIPMTKELRTNKLILLSTQGRKYTH